MIERALKGDSAAIQQINAFVSDHAESGAFWTQVDQLPFIREQIEPLIISKPAAAQSDTSILKRLIAERNAVARWLSKVPRAVTVFGSARIPESDPAYKLAEAFGAALFIQGLVHAQGRVQASWKPC